MALQLGETSAPAEADLAEGHNGSDLPDPLLERPSERVPDLGEREVATVGRVERTGVLRGHVAGLTGNIRADRSWASLTSRNR